jgi:hypothetical protein
MTAAQKLEASRRRSSSRTQAHSRCGRRDAAWPEADALDAIDFAEAAVVEAEYAVLDAAVARKNADDLAASA